MANVNAPFAGKLDAESLAMALRERQSFTTFAGHLSSFFYDVPLALQWQFAADHGISRADLADLARSFSRWSGKSWPGVEAA